MQNGEEDLTPLIELLASRLQEGQAFSEYDLMRFLQEPEQGIFAKDALKENRTLFQSHFLLMHALYLLQQKWASECSAVLFISALHIEKKPWPKTSSNQNISSYDPLAEYYLDLRQLDTSEEDIADLLRQFWQKMLLSEQEEHDRQTLELSSPIEVHRIKLHYRRLAKLHHPDKGGDAGEFRRITAAYQRLRQKYL